MTACWGIVPAAGVGRRMNSDLPKQYLKLAGKQIIEHSIAPLLRCSTIAKIIVVLSEDDVHWRDTVIKDHPKIETCFGAASRAQSVRNGLMRCKSDAEDWILVHDAVRPCLNIDELESLLASTWDDPIGAISAISISDSMKRVRRGADHSLRVVETLTRNDLWMRAATPQMFRYRLLCDALYKATVDGVDIDDEASAMQHAGHEVKVVPGDYRNIKLSYPADLNPIRLYLNDARR